MKKLFCLFLALLLAVSCFGCASSDKPVNEENHSQGEMVTSDSGPAQNDAEQHALSDEDILQSLEGMYLPVKYVDAVKENRRLNDAYPHRLGLWVIKNDDGSYRVGGGDLHQGGLDLGIIDTVEQKDGKYVITTAPAEYGTSAIMTCAPEGNTVAVEMIGESSFWYAGEPVIDFYKYSREDGGQPEIANIIFGNRDAVSYKEDGTYITIDNKEYKLEFVLSGVVAGPLETGLSSCDGYILLYEDNVVGGYYGEYLINEDKIQIVVPDLNINIEI